MVHLIVVNLTNCPRSFKAAFMSVEHKIFNIFQFTINKIGSVAQMVTNAVKKK